MKYFHPSWNELQKDKNIQDILFLIQKSKKAMVLVSNKLYALGENQASLILAYYDDEPTRRLRMIGAIKDSNGNICNILDQVYL